MATCGATSAAHARMRSPSKTYPNCLRAEVSSLFGRGGRKREIRGFGGRDVVVAGFVAPTVTSWRLHHGGYIVTGYIVAVTS